MRLAALLLLFVGLASCSNSRAAPPINLTGYIGTHENAEIIHIPEIETLITNAMGGRKKELEDLLSASHAAVKACDKYLGNGTPPDWCIVLTGSKSMLSIAYVKNWRGPHMEIEASLVHSPEPETWATFNEPFGGDCLVYKEHTDNLSSEDEIVLSDGLGCN